MLDLNAPQNTPNLKLNVPPPDIEPVPNLDDLPFWEETRSQILAFQQCLACEQVRHPPMAVCPNCQSRSHSWIKCSGRGRIYSFTIVHHPMDESVRNSVPYAAIVVEFATIKGVRFLSNLIGCDLSQVKIGAEVELVWQPLLSGYNLPRFKLVR